MAIAEEATKRTYQNTEQRQTETVEAVVHLCAEQDPSTLTTARIADEVGLSQGALFKHFPNKNSLWESVAKWVSGQLTERVFSVADQHEQADKALEAMFLAHISFIARHPGIPRLMLGELQKPGNQPAKRIIRQTLAFYRQKVVALLHLGIDQKCISPTIDTEAAAVLYIGAIQGLVVQAMVGGDIMSIEESAARIFKLFSASIRASDDGE